MIHKANLTSSKDISFLDDYWSRYHKILFEARDDKKLIEARNLILNTKDSGGKLIFVGNGASASLASHASTDFTKQAKIKSISFNDHNLITALANDYGYEKWVEKALFYYADERDLVFFISVSGQSENLINGFHYAKLKNIKTISFTGADKNNLLNTNSDCSLWVNSRAYNIVESIHTIWLTLIIDLIVGEAEYSVSL